MIICAAALALSACSGGTAEANLAQIDNQIAQADIDPAVSGAIEDEILVDPNLVQQSNPNGVRHPERPLQAPYPTDQQQPSRAGAPVQQANAALPGDPEAPFVGACGAAFQYGPEWADRLPAEFPPYPNGRVTEAAGINGANCRMRVVTFTTNHNFQQVLDWYGAAASRGGFSAEHLVKDGDHVLGGVNQGNDGAFYLIVTPKADGCEVALIVNNGR